MYRLLRKVAGAINSRIGLSFERMFLYKKSRPDGASALGANEKDLQWELLAVGGIDRLLEVGPFDVKDGVQRLRRGDSCYTVCIDGRLAHYSWVQRSGLHLILKAGISLPVRSGEFWIYNCRTAEWARTRGIYTATLKKILGDHFAAGYPAAWIYTLRKNIASQTGILRAGFKPLTTLTAIRLGSRYYSLERERAPFISEQERAA